MDICFIINRAFNNNMNNDTLNNEKAIRTIKLLLFTASIIPSILGGALSFYFLSFDWESFILVTFALFIGQAGGDYLYYYFTHRHTDSRDSHTKIFAGWRPLFADALPQEKGTLWAGIVCLAIDFIIGIYFVTQIGYVIIIFALLGGLVAIFFTPLMLKGYKEPVIFITFGPLCVAGMYFVLTSNLDIYPFIISLPIAFLVTVVAYLKGAHFELKKDNGEDVIIKLSKTRIIVLSNLSYLSLVLITTLSILPYWLLLGMLSMPISYSVISVIKKERSRVQDYLWAVVRSIYALLVMGILMSLGLMIESV
jgi:1,4-dihydroxy-2-naphthoate octaprenyltransferase